MKRTNNYSKQQELEIKLTELEVDEEYWKRSIDRSSDVTLFALAILFGIICNIGTNFIYEKIKKYPIASDISILLTIITLACIIILVWKYDRIMMNNAKKQKQLMSKIKKLISEIEKETKS
jgi:hypothetical protein